jgi:hypothetical protein
MLGSRPLADWTAKVASGAIRNRRKKAFSRARAADGIDGKTRRVVIDTDAYPAGILADVVDAVGHSAAKLLDQKESRGTRTGSGEPLGRHSRPAFLKSPTNSFFLVSTEMAGSPLASAAFTCSLM